MNNIIKWQFDIKKKLIDSEVFSQMFNKKVPIFEKVEEFSFKSIY